MKIDKITLHNFRNLIDQSVDFGPNLNIICGNNGTGKTNLLESVYFSSIGRSPRTRKDTDCLAFNQKQAHITLHYTRANTLRSLDIDFGTNTKKSVTLDNTPTPRISDIVGNFGSVYFSPDETQIVRGSPSARRRFLDIILCQIDKTYMLNLSKLQHATLVRNTMLKKLKSLSYPLELEAYDTVIATLSSHIILTRAKFIQTLSARATTIHQSLSGNLENITLSYQTFVNNPLTLTPQNIIDIYFNLVKTNYTRDQILGYSTIGIHNDDFDITLHYITTPKSINVRRSASLGQQRTATLALKLAEVLILQDEYGEPPVLLLDDVFGELDNSRQQKLLEFCQNYQTILTCTTTLDNLSATTFTIKDGIIQKL